MSVRKPCAAGGFYPENKEKLNELINYFFKEAKDSDVKNLKAIIVPHAGYVYSGIVAAAGYNLLKKEDFNKVILLGPCHSFRFGTGAFDENDSWQTPLGEIKVSLFETDKMKKMSMAHAQEHSLEVQVPFLQSLDKEFEFIPIAMGGYDKELILELEKNIDDKTILVISSDLSHYLSYENAVKKDKETINKILNFEHVQGEEACGYDGINILIEIAKKKNWKPILIDYKNSGDTTGPRMEVVGYAAIGFTK